MGWTGIPEPDLRPELAVGLALGVLVLPLRWVAALVLAGMVHELGHILVLRLYGVPVLGIRLGLTGAEIRTGYMLPVPEIVAALAGPVGSLALMALLPWYPELGICGLIQGIVNLLPVYPCDGGRIVYGLGRILWPAWAERITRWAGTLVLLGLMMAGLWLGFCQSGRWGLILAGEIALTGRVYRNISCKDGPLAVQ